MSQIRIPGAFWLALIAFVATWLPQIVPGADWMPLALLILAAVGKALEVLLSPRITEVRTTGPSYTTTTAQGEKLRSTPTGAVDVRHANPVIEWLFG